MLESLVEKINPCALLVSLFFHYFYPEKDNSDLLMTLLQKNLLLMSHTVILIQVFMIN